MKSLILKLTIVTLTIALMTGCIVYKADVQQGNEITEEMVSQLELGMTKREVYRLLGNPLINDPFHKDRWDYYYSMKAGDSGDVQRQAASLIFEDDLLKNFTSSFE